MRMVNRAAVVVTPKQPFLDWGNSLEPGGVVLTLDTVMGEPTVYLVRDVEDEAAVQRVLRRHFAEIFEHELAGWWTDPGAWPQQRDFRTFKKWFDVAIHSLVFDLEQGTIVHDMQE